MKWCGYEPIGDRLCRCARCGSLCKQNDCNKCVGVCRKFCVFEVQADGSFACVRGGCKNVLPPGSDIEKMVECDGGRPGQLTLAKNYALAASKHVAAGMPIRTSERIAEIAGICKQNICGLYNAHSNWCEHRKCGCNVEEKAAWEKEECPLRLWT